MNIAGLEVSSERTRRFPAGIRWHRNKIREASGVPCRMTLLLAGWLGMMAVPAARADDPFVNTIAASRAYITNIMAQHNIPGCTIVLVDSQRVVWAEGFGYADKETQTPVTTNTVMAIGSVSKLLTALMALQIVDEGAFDLDASITNYVAEFAMLPRFSGQEEGWTLRTLLDHHAGLPGDIYNGAFVTGSYRPGFMPWLIDYFQSNYPLYPPGLQASYGNSGVNVAGEAVARLDGVDFTVSAENRLFTPLDMPYASFLLEKPDMRANLATGYSADGAPSAELQANMPATGGAYARAVDLANVIRMLLANGMFGGEEFISTNAITELGTFTPGPLDMDNFFKPGLGLDSVDDPALSYAGRAWLKSGSTSKFEALLVVLPDQQLGAFVNINCGNNTTFAILREVLALAVEEKGGPSRPPSPSPPEAVETAWTFEQLQALEGWYITRSGVDRFVAETNGSLTRIVNVQAGGSAVTNLRPRVNGRFYVPGHPEEQWAFTNTSGYDVALRYGSDGGARDELVYGGYAETLHGTRYTPPAISGAWSNRAFTFWVADNLLHDDNFLAEGSPPGHMLALHDGILSIASSGGEATLVPVNDALAMVGGLSARTDSSVRIETNAASQERLWFGGYRGMRVEDIPPVTNQQVIAVSLAIHTNALMMYVDGEPGRAISVRMSENAADAMVSVISLDSGDVVARGEGSVEWTCDAEPAVIHVASPHAVDAQVKVVDVTEVREAMQRTLAQYPHIPGFGVAAQEPGFLPLIVTEGYARISPPSAGPSRPLLGHEQFHIASISKTYTAAAIFLLHQRGLLDITHCVTNYAPELNIPRAAEITLDMLLQHRSGLPDANNTYWFDGKLTKNPLLEFTVEEIVDVANWLYPDLMFEPGTGYHYTDTGFNILARVVEHVAQTNYQAFLRNEVLLPLGLTNTFAPYNDQIEVPEPSVSTYIMVGGERRDLSVWNPSVEFGCGSVIATLEDLLGMPHAFFMTTNLLDDSTRAMMMDEISPTGLTTYGRGCNMVEGLGWGHDGTMWGALSIARVDTNDGVRVSSVMNAQYEDERIFGTFLAMNSSLGLLKNALGFDAGMFGQAEPVVLPLLGPARQNRPYRFQMIPLNFPTNWIVSGLPGGMTIDPATGEITGTPLASGSYNVTITAENGYGSAQEMFTLDVATGYTNTIAVISDAITSLMEAEDAVGLSIALVDDQDVVWAQGFGHADREAGIPVTTDTVFRIGSVSKSFTSAAVLQYDERGLLDVSAPFTNYAPSVSWLPRFTEARPISSIDLMTHHSGLPGDMFRAGFLTSPLGQGYDYTTNDLARTYPMLPPGIRNNYGNVGFVLLETVIESAAANEQDDQPFAHLVNDRIFEPLGMDASSYLFDKPLITSQLAIPYQGGVRLPEEYIEILGTGSMYSRPLDLAKFIQSIFSDTPLILRPDTRDWMLDDHSGDALFGDLNWIKTGLGWDTVSDPRFVPYGLKACWKTGGTMAYTAQLMILPEKKLGVAITCSSLSSIPMLIDGLTLQLALEERDGVEPPVLPPRVPGAEVAVEQEQLDALAGVYLGNTGYDLVEAHPGSLTYLRNVPSSERVYSNLTLRADGWFESTNHPALRLAFTNLHGRDVVLYEAWAGDAKYHDVYSERFTPPAGISAAWSNRLNRTWIARNRPANDFILAVGGAPDVRLALSNGVLFIEAGDLVATRALDPVSDTLAWIPGFINRGDAALQIEEIDGVEHIRYGGYIFGPEAADVPATTFVAGSIGQPGFSAWYRIEPEHPGAPQGGISNVLYELMLSGAPGNFLMRLFEEDGVTPVDARTGNGSLVVESTGDPLLLNLQPDITGVQTGAYQVAFNIPLLMREIAGESPEHFALVWQGPTGLTYEIQSAPILATNTFAAAGDPVHATNLLNRAILPAGPDAVRFWRVVE